MRPNTLTISSLLAALSLPLIVAPALASPAVSYQTLSQSELTQSITINQLRAANMARMQAELLNGGLGEYTSDNCMHRGGGGKCLVSNTTEGYRFRFLGGPPGWAGRGDKAMVETVVLVSPDAKQSRVEYNGPVRPVKLP
jgi:hypothetical protein